MRIIRQSTVLCATVLAAWTGACPAAPHSSPLQDAVILIIRHAEKPETGPELTPGGVWRAETYVNYFKNFQLDSEPLKLDWLMAAADSKNSHRPRLTLTPLSRELKLPLDTRFKDKDFQELAGEIKSRPRGRHILICWHHGEIPDLLRVLGADPAKLLPHGKWPASVFGWLIELRYDHEGQLMPGESRRINEELMPDDSVPTTAKP